MYVELHILQNFAPSCLNRDDTNSPKDCEFGGYRRARISSQCLKRSIRKQFEKDGTVASSELGLRTKLIIDHITGALKERGKNEEEARAVVKAALEALELHSKEKNQTEYLLFLGKDEVGRLVDLCIESWNELAKIGERTVPAEVGGKLPDSKKSKKETKATLSPELSKRIREVISDTTRAVDVALFGRMVADRPGLKIDAACQVAHALSTHRVSMEMDFFTAVDDLQRDEDTGAGMMGTVEYNSACFYRYSVIDVEQLKNNLKNEPELAMRAIKAFIRASVSAIPSGKQNSMAAHNPPNMVFAVVRKGGQPISLANAFAKPVWSGKGGDLITNSIAALDSYWGAIMRMYGKDDIATTGLVILGDAQVEWTVKDGKKVDTIPELISTVEGALNSVHSPAPN